MGRKRLPDGKRVTFSCRLSEPIAAAAADRCAELGLTRSAWLQALVAADLGQVPSVSEQLAAEIRDALAATERGETEDLGSFAKPRRKPKPPAPAVTFSGAGHAPTCKCGMCRPSQ